MEIYKNNEVLAKVLFCHSRGSNRESGFFQKQRLLDTRFHGYDGTGRFAETFARASNVRKSDVNSSFKLLFNLAE